MDMIALETMARGLAPFLLVKVALVIGGTWLAAWGLSSASAATRHAVWSLALGGLWLHVAVGIWMFGGLVVAVQLVGGLAWVYRREQQATALQNPDRRRLVRVLGEKIGLQRTIAVTYGPRGEGQAPMVWGILRPPIWLPAKAQSWPVERFRAVLLHELAHVKRGDYLVHLAVQCAQAACWRAEGALAMGHQANFKGRMRALLDKDTDRSPLGLRTGLLMSATGGLFALLVTALNFGMTPVQAGTSSYVWLEAEAGALPLRGGHVGDV